MTTTVRLSPLCLGFSNSRSRPSFGFTAHLTCRWFIISWKQHRQPMHLRIISAFPAWALLHHSGSARCPRATPTKSQQPSISICSATSGSLMLQTAIIGMFTCFFTSAAMYLFQHCSYVPGSIVAQTSELPGIPPQLTSMKSTPASSNLSQILQLSSRSFPSFPRNSSTESRTPSGKSPPHCSLMPWIISSRKRIRFSKLPP